jgi:YjjG family noncanonical pyrimidine nucleotidase
MVRKYRHLFFDLDNTLYNFEKNSYEAMKDAFLALGLYGKIESFDEFFQVYLKINTQLWADYREKKISKEILRRRRFAESFAAYNHTICNDPIEIDEKYLALMPEKTELFPGTLEILAELKSRKYLLHIITNGFREVQHDKLLNTGLRSFFEKVFISEDLKTTKPSREIFEHAIKSCNARKKESLMIGDSWETDVEGARLFGIDQVYFTPFSEWYKYSQNERPTYHIFSLSELLVLLP